MISGPALIRPPPAVPAVSVAGRIEEHKKPAGPRYLLSWQSVCSSSLPQSKLKNETVILTVVPTRKRSSYYLLLGKKERKRSRGHFKNYLPVLLKFGFANPTWSTRRKMLSVYLYIPNIIGYVRVFMNCIAFGCCSFNKKLFIFFYFISFVLDGVDGWLARKFNQVSTFGAVLDMVTDRVSTACLLVVLSQFYSPGLIFLSLLALDIASHWLQMYSTFLSGKASHKDVKDSSSWLFKLYYGNRLFMAYCCVGTEVLYIILFFLGKTYSDSVLEVIMITMKEQSFISILTALSLCGWAIKQAINLIQMKNAADVCVAYDMTRRDRP